MILLPPEIGHRGAAGLAPENTLAGFRHAAALGVAMVEFDVRLSADGRPVVFHDDRLERTSTGSGPVADHSLAALKTLDAGSWFAPRFAGEAIPTLDEVLALCRELGLGVNLEIKPDPGREAETARIALERTLALWPASAQPPLVSSFAAASLAVARAAAAHWPRGLLVETIPPDWRQSVRALDCAAIGADHHGLDDAAVAEVRSSGLLVLAYTVNDQKRQTQLRTMGVSSVFTDFPHSS